MGEAMNLLQDVANGDPISPEEFVELRKMRYPRPADYVVAQPHVTDTCSSCLSVYPIELAVINSWKPMTIVCPDCHGITA